MHNRIAAAALAASVLLLTACSGGDSGGSASNGSSGGTLTLGSSLAPKSLAVPETAWANTSPYLQAVYDSLLRTTPAGELEPWLATEWQYDDARTTLTMKLRDDVTFSDGTKFDAEAAAENLLRFKNGAGPQSATLALMTEATAVDASTLKISLSAPDPGFLVYLSQNAGLMASPAKFDSPDEKTHPIGSGPYVLDPGSTVIGSEYVYTKNENYWEPNAQHYDKLVIKTLPDSTTQLNAIKGRQVNGVTFIDTSVLPQVEASGFSLNTADISWVGLVFLDRDGVLAPELANVKVRQAINHAIDDEGMLKAGLGRGTPTDQPLAPTGEAYDEALDERYPFDPDKARTLLAEAGYPDGFDLNLPALQVGNNAVHDLVKQYLGDVGIRVTNNQLSLADGVTAVLQGKYPATVFTLSALPNDWVTAAFWAPAVAPFNPFKVKDPQAEEILKRMQVGDDASSALAAKEFNKYVVEQAWFDPWYRGEAVFGADENTVVEMQADNAYPYLWNIKPKK